MSASTDEERTSLDLTVMTRAQVVDELTHFPGAVQLDFTAEFVANQSLGQLKHILAAARMHITLKSDEKCAPPTFVPAN